MEYILGSLLAVGLSFFELKIGYAQLFLGVRVYKDDNREFYYVIIGIQIVIALFLLIYGFYKIFFL